MFRILITRTFYKIINPIRTVCWFIFRPQRRGVKCLIEHNGKFLFISNSYGTGRWTIPGGGVGYWETLEEAALRETKEEVGITPPFLDKLSTYENKKEYKTDLITLFYTKVNSPNFVIDPVEIKEARWASLGNIPEPHGSVISTMAKMYQKLKNVKK